LINPEVTVSILEYRPLFVNGEVEKPGGFPFSPGLTVRKAISLAGGFKERANKGRINVVRETDPRKASRSIDVDDQVMPGDIITVERSFF
jgi:polysaccharide export outer membrane protein